VTRCDIYHGDCREIAPTLDYTAVISDPPYGMAWNTDTTRFSGGSQGNRRPGDGVAGRGAVAGDHEPFDPSPWLDRDRVVLFGSNHFASRLPTGTMLVWIKRNEAAYGTFLSDAELAWMKGGRGVYCRRDLSLEAMKLRGGRSHPTQKPVGLMRWCIEQARVTPDDVVLDPYMGSGTTAIACLDLGVPFVGIGIDREHFETAQRRIAEHQVQSDLFAGSAT